MASEQPADREQPAKREIPRAYQTGRRSGSTSYHRDRYLSGKKDVDGRPGIGSTWDRYAVLSARALVLLSLSYAAWRFGGTDAEGQFHLSVLLGIASILTLTARRTFTRKSRRLPVAFFTMGLLWIGYAGVQTLPIPGAMAFAFPGPTSIHDRIGDAAVSRLETAIKQIDGTQLPARSGKMGSVNAELTRQAMVPFLLAFAIMVLSVILFESRQSRMLYLWFLVVHTSLLAAWGIIQRANDNAQILPGIENTYSGIPFASFIYKNAGAAALLPGLAAIAALLYGQRNRGRGRLWGAATSSQSILFQPRTLTLIALAGLLTTGLLASLSRGAWIAAIVAAAIGCLASRVKMSNKQLAVVTLSLLILITSVFTLTGLRETVTDRVDSTTVIRVSGDQRWEHWKDGAAAAWFYTPSGSGLGTYGFASLPLQSGPRISWFREAHNQYLEVLTESGVIGFALMCVAMAWFGVIAWRLLRQDEHREKSSWGLFGLLILLFGATQSVIDFVLKIPANMLLYASMIGVVAAAERSYAAFLRSRVDEQPLQDNHAKDPIRRTELQYSLSRMPALWCLIGIGAIALGGFHAHRHACGDRIIKTIRDSRVDEQPTAESVDLNLSLLNQAIEGQAGRADLYRRRSNWNFNEYRLSLVESAAAVGEPLAWDDTRPEALETTIAALDAETRQLLIDELLATPELRRQIGSTLNDLSKSLQRNPLDPVTHMSCLILSPLAGMPVRPWIESTAELNKNSPSLLFSTGLLAYEYDLLDLAIDQWSQSIFINQEHLEDIHLLARSKLTTDQIARHLVPHDRTDLFARLIHDADQQSPMLAADVGEELIHFLQEDTLISPGAKAAALADIYRIVGDDEQSIVHWEKAVDLDARNPYYRWNFAESLRRNGDFEKALQQSILGGTLFQGDDRFTQLTLQIRKNIRRQQNFD